MPVKKEPQRSLTAGAVLEKCAQLGAFGGGSHISIHFQGVVRCFDNKQQLQNNDGRMTIYLSNEEAESLIVELTNALKAGYKIQ